MTSHIIVVEDDPRMAKSIQRLMEAAGYSVELAANAAQFWRAHRQHPADVVLLDRILGEEDGIHLAREVLRMTSVGLILVTGLDGPEDRVEGLDLGADDYIVKPFIPEEMLARVRATLRKHGKATPTSQPLQVGPISMDAGARYLYHQALGERVEFTETETRILESLLRNPGRPVSRAALVGRDRLAPEERAVDVHIAHIRKKLDRAGIHDIHIRAVRGLGYRANLVEKVEKNKPS